MMEILEVRRKSGEGTAEITGLIRRGSERFDLYFRFPERYRDFLAPGPEPFLCALLVPAMSRGESLSTRLPVSPDLLRGFRRAQVALQGMYPKLLRSVPVEAPLRTDPVQWQGEPRRLGSFFSCGVDSFYTCLSNQQNPKPGFPPLTHALFMRGLETELEQDRGVAESAALARHAARALGLELIEGESNLRSFFSVGWLAWSGTGLAATAHALGRGFEVFLIPSGSRYWTVAPPNGSHPLIDESCSAEWLRIHHDGAHAGRPYKIATLVGQSELALSSLRICTLNRGASYNCGECSKCIRTMVAMEAAGVLERARTLPTRLPADWHRVYRPNFTTPLEECLAIARERNRPRGFVRDLERALRRVRVRNAARELFETTRLRHLLPAVRRVRALRHRPSPN
ncbi:MAG TPA: hypothetical protein VI383_09525 [Gemmatimonadales bacterium]|nr:hypothetical protein [Gemmatimonadales bacterium]